MPGPLDGIRVVDLTSMVSGPLATMMLGDQGADVIKVEAPGAGGDHTRGAANRRGGMSASFLHNNRNKRSIVLDLKSDAGRAALLRIAARADVFVQNFRPGVVERLGVGEDAVRAVAPKVIYVSLSGFGETGPFAQKPVYDPLVQALSGLASVQAGSDDARPRLVRTILPDKLTGIVAAQAISSRRLFARERTGQGQHIRLSMLEAVSAFLWGSDMGSQTFVDGDLPQQEAASFADLIYETATTPISVAVQSDREWRALVTAIGEPSWLEDERFLTVELRQRHIDDRLALTQEVLRTGLGRRMAEAADRSRRPLRAGADAHADADRPAVRGDGHRHRDRASAGRPHPRGAPGRALFGDAAGAAPPGAGLRRGYGRRATRGRLETETTSRRCGKRLRERSAPGRRSECAAVTPSIPLAGAPAKHRMQEHFAFSTTQVSPMLAAQSPIRPDFVGPPSPAGGREGSRLMPDEIQG